MARTKTKKNKARRKITVLAVLLFLLCAVAGVVMSGIFEKDKPEDPKRVIKYDTSSYLSSLTAKISAGTALRPTAFDGIYCAVSEDGSVAFYALTGKTFEKIDEDGVYACSAVLSGQTVKADVHYIVRDGKTDGYGLFTSSLDDSVYYFEYAFFRLTELPAGFRSSNKLLLLIDTDKSRFYADKLYSEAFYYDTADRSVGATFFSDEQRTVGSDGKFRADYRMFTDEILDQPQSNFLFLSSRFYLEHEGAGYVDIMSNGSSGNNLDNIRVIERVLGYVFWRDDAGVHYFTPTDDGFDLCVYDDKQTSVGVSFEGSYSGDYIRCGRFLLHKKSGKVFAFFKGEEYKIPYAPFRQGFVPDVFAISPDGRYAFVRGISHDGLPAIGLCDVETGRTWAHTNAMFDSVSSVTVTNDGSCVVTVGKSASAMTTYVFDINAVPEYSTDAQ